MNMLSLPGALGKKGSKKPAHIQVREEDIVSMIDTTSTLVNLMKKHAMELDDPSGSGEKRWTARIDARITQKEIDALHHAIIIIFWKTKDAERQLQALKEAHIAAMTNQELEESGKQERGGDAT